MKIIIVSYLHANFVASFALGRFMLHDH